MPRTALSRVRLKQTKKFASRPIASLVGAKLVRITRRGKNILIWFDDGRCLGIHLGMTGQLYWTSLEGHADRHTHLRLEFEQSDQVLHFRDVRRFGRLKLYRSKSHLLAEAAMAKLGPEPLHISLGDFKERLGRRRMSKPQPEIQSVTSKMCTPKAASSAQTRPSKSRPQAAPIRQPRRCSLLANQETTNTRRPLSGI